MNEVELSGQPARPYDNTLRREQAQATRERILEHAIRALAEAGPEGVTLAELARGAGVSEPTLYRHFGSRERLYEELEARVQAEVGLPPVPARLSDLPSHASAVFETMAGHEQLIRAVVRTGVGREVHRQGRSRRTALLRRILAEQAPHLDAVSRERLLALLRVLVSWESYERLTTELGLAAAEAGETVEWMLGTLLKSVMEEGAVVGVRRRDANAAG
jgi:AcrR family transcriptional regulator